MKTFTATEAARLLFDHPAFKHGLGNRFDSPGNEWVRLHWTNAAMIALKVGFDPEGIARALYEYPEWGYQQSWGQNSRVCTPWREAAADLVFQMENAAAIGEYI